MSEGTRRPDGSSGPATTEQNKPSGGDDIYAAAAASAAKRTAKPAQGARSAGDNGTTPTAPPARSQQAAAQSGAQADGANSGASGGAQSGGPAAALGNVAGQVINAVRPSRAKAAPAAEGGAGAKHGTEPAGTAASPAAPVGQPASQPVDDNTRQVPPLVGPGAREPRPAEADADQTQVQPAVRDDQAATAETKKAASKKTEKAEKAKAGAPRGTRKARLRLSRLDPWSVMKTAFMFSIAAGIVLVVAVYAVWLVIGSSGLFASIDSIVGSVLQSPGDTTPFRIEDYVNTQKVMGVTAFLACIDVVIFTALATLASFLYNLAATMLGGLEVTLAED